MTAQEWAAIITALGLGAILPEIIRAIIRGVTGKVGRERSVVQYERDRVRAVQKEADDRAKRTQADIDALDEKIDGEIVKRRAAESRAARYERLLILHGIQPDAVWTGENTIPVKTKENGKEES